MWAAFVDRLRALKREVATVWFCTRHPRTPLVAKLLAALIVAYAFSPIDLIPDFIPVLGYVDELFILPLGVWVVMKLIPDDVIAECHQQAAAWLAEKRPKPRNYVAGAVIVAIWLSLLWLSWLWLAPKLTA